MFIGIALFPGPCHFVFSLMEVEEQQKTGKAWDHVTWMRGGRRGVPNYKCMHTKCENEFLSSQVETIF